MIKYKVTYIHKEKGPILLEESERQIKTTFDLNNFVADIRKEFGIHCQIEILIFEQDYTA